MGNGALKKREEKYHNQFVETKGDRERAEMERKANARFFVGYIDVLKHPNKRKGFYVLLNMPLSEEDIQSRMMKGFGDL